MKIMLFIPIILVILFLFSYLYVNDFNIEAIEIVHKGVFEGILIAAALKIIFDF